MKLRGQYRPTAHYTPCVPLYILISKNISRHQIRIYVLSYNLFYLCCKADDFPFSFISSLSRLSCPAEALCVRNLSLFLTLTSTHSFIFLLLPNHIWPSMALSEIYRDVYRILHL